MVLPMGWLAGEATPSHDAGDQAVQADPVFTEKETNLTVRLAHLPASAVLRSGEKEIGRWTPANGNEWTQRTTLPYHEGHSVELLVEVKWPANTPRTVAEVTIEPDALPARMQTAWGEGELSELLNFTWESQP
jgi:hypothetical protein